MSNFPPLLRAPTLDNPSPTQSNNRPFTPRPVTGVDPITGAVTTAPGLGQTGGTPEQNDAMAYLASYLRESGLESLSDWAWQQIIAGNSPTIIIQELYKTPQFKARFPAYFARRDRNLAPMSVAQIIDYENRARQLFRQYGIPAGFYDSIEELQDFLANDVSLAELNDRIQMAAEVFYSTDPYLRSEITRMYGWSPTPGQEIATILDPAKAVPLIQRQITAATFGSASLRSTYGQITTQEAEELYGYGISTPQAAQGFAELAGRRELFTALPGEAQTAQGVIDTTIARAEQLGAQFGSNATAQERIRRAAERRVAAFRGRAQFVESREGVLGLGTSNR